MFLLRFLLQIFLTTAVVWLLGEYLPEYVTLGGELRGLLLVGTILSLLNISVRIVLEILTFPLRLFLGLLVFIAVNAFLLWLAELIVQSLPQGIAVFDVHGGFFGWIIVSIIFGLLSWLLKALQR